MRCSKTVMLVLGLGLPLLLLPASALATSYSAAVLADNPAMYWSFDGLNEDSSVPEMVAGITADCLAPTNATLAAHTDIASGLFLGSAGNLKQTKATFFAADLSPTEALPGAYAIEFWLRADNNLFAYIANFGSGSPYPGDKPGVLRSWASASKTGAIDIEGTGKTLGSPAVTDGAWHHYALLVYGASDSTWGVAPRTEIMIDGGTPVNITNTFTGKLNWQGPVAVGAAFGPGVGPAGGATYNVNGYIDEFAIYDLNGKSVAQIEAFRGNLTDHFNIAQVPEPSTLVGLLGLCLAGFVAAASRKR